MWNKLLLPVFITILTSTSLCAQWVSIAPSGLNQFGSVLVLGAMDHLICGETMNFHTTDGGTNWAPQTGLGVESIRDLLRLDAQTILASSDGVVFRSVNNGGSWTVVNTPANDDLHALARNGDTVFAVGRSGWIIRSTDAGLTWTPQSSGTAERLFCVAALSPTEAMAGGRNGVFLRTTNGGTTWTASAVPANDDWVGIHFFSSAPATGLLCGEDGNMLRTTDGGLNWTAVATGITMGFGAMASAHDSVVYVVGTAGRVLRSTDMGLSWSPMTSPAFSDLTAVDVNNGVAVAVGANGTVLKLGGTSIGVGLGEQLALEDLLVYPNPAQDQLWLRTGSDLTGTPELEIRSVDGRLVQRTRLGTAQRAVDVSALPNSSYSLVLWDAAGRVAVRRFTVAR